MTVVFLLASLLLVVRLQRLSERSDLLTDFPPLRNQEQDYTPVLSYLEGSIRTHGTEETKWAVDSTGADLDVALSHVLAHAFGEALYRTLGLSAFDVCDDKFSYGCIHQFTGMAISEYGDSVIQRLVRECLDKWGSSALGCAHALGHGVTAYYGYDLNDLRRSMTTCDMFDSDAAEEKCLTGVFMEYNFHQMAGTEAALVEPRPFTKANPFEPCDSLVGSYRDTCFHQLPLWWLNTVGWEDGRTAFTSAGRYCASASRYGEGPAAGCFKGIGLAVAVFTDLDANEAGELCGLASTDRERQLLCIGEFAFKARIAGRTDARQECASFGLIGEELGSCVSQAMR